MVRIQDSQSWHTGSIPVGTTTKKATKKLLFFVYKPNFFKIPLYICREFVEFTVK